MSAEYRQKLLNWLTSMMVLMLVQSAALAWTWVWLLRAQSQNTFGGWLPYTMAYRMGAVLEIFIVGFVLAAFWHFFDFLQRGDPRDMSFPRLSRYRTICQVSLLCALPIVVFAPLYLSVFQGSAFAGPDCGGILAMSYAACETAGPGQYLAALIFLPAMIFQCISKAFIAISSRQARQE